MRGPRSNLFRNIENGNARMPKARGSQVDRILAAGSSLAAFSTPFNKWNAATEAIDNVGSLSSGYGGYYCDNGINIAILALTLAGLAAMFWILYTKITMLVGRKRRHAEVYNTPVHAFPYIYNIEDTILEIFWGRPFLLDDY